MQRGRGGEGPRGLPGEVRRPAPSPPQAALSLPRVSRELRQQSPSSLTFHDPSPPASHLSPSALPPASSHPSPALKLNPFAVPTSPRLSPQTPHFPLRDPPASSSPAPSSPQPAPFPRSHGDPLPPTLSGRQFPQARSSLCPGNLTVLGEKPPDWAASPPQTPTLGELWAARRSQAPGDCPPHDLFSVHLSSASRARQTDRTQKSEQKQTSLLVPFTRRPLPNFLIQFSFHMIAVQIIITWERKRLTRIHFGELK